MNPKNKKGLQTIKTTDKKEVNFENSKFIKDL